MNKAYEIKPGSFDVRQYPFNINSPWTQPVEKPVEKKEEPEGSEVNQSTDQTLTNSSD